MLLQRRKASQQATMLFFLLFLPSSFLPPSNVSPVAKIFTRTIRDKKKRNRVRGDCGKRRGEEKAIRRIRQIGRNRRRRRRERKRKRKRRRRGRRRQRKRVEVLSSSCLELSQSLSLQAALFGLMDWP